MLLIGGHAFNALTLHALHSEDRVAPGKDDPEILTLIRIHSINPDSPELREIFDRYSTPTIRERLLRDIGEFF